MSNPQIYGPGIPPTGFSPEEIEKLFARTMNMLVAPNQGGISLPNTETQSPVRII